MNGGLVILSQLKKILISLPDSLLQEVDSIVMVERTNRSEFVREAMKLYIREKRRIEMRDKMKKGYQEMAEINLKLAEMCFDADTKLQLEYEEKLAECE
jgi:CopG family transcriptional regulator/antitoxin EndoAI